MIITSRNISEAAYTKKNKEKQELSAFVVGQLFVLRRLRE